MNRNKEINMRRLRFGTMCVVIISLLAPTVAAPAVEGEFAINLPSVVSLKDRLNTYGEKLPDLDKLGIRKIVAYEENELFTYMMGQTPVSLRRIFFIKPCRVVVLGCGAGTNPEYLAGKGFEVTAIDISPTCLVRAREKSDITGSGVKWMLADVLAPPDMEPFDFIFDRGCYHNIRRHNAAGFVKASNKLSKPGTKFMLLAGNANEKKHWGPPRIKESEIRKDFSPSFKILSMKQSWFDLGRKGPSKTGPMAWFVLMVRKKDGS